MWFDISFASHSFQGRLAASWVCYWVPVYWPWWKFWTLSSIKLYWQVLKIFTGSAWDTILFCDDELWDRQTRKTLVSHNAQSWSNIEDDYSTITSLIHNNFSYHNTWIEVGSWHYKRNINNSLDQKQTMRHRCIESTYIKPSKPVYSISQEICTRFLLCCALLWLYIDWFSHIHQAYFTGTVAI